MLRNLILAIFAAVITCTTATAGTFGVHLGSWHSAPGYNNTNPGAYYRTDSGVVAGAYRNSLLDVPENAGHLVTAYAAKVWTHDTSFGDVSVMAGAAVGYKIAPVVPMAAVSIRAGNVRVSVLPCMHGSIVVHASLEF